MAETSVRTQQILIKRSSNKKGNPCKKDIEKSGNSGTTYGDYFKQIDQLSLKARNLYNQGNYIVRQEYFKTRKEKEQGLRENANWIRYNDLDKICQKIDPPDGEEVNAYRAIHCANIAQHTLKLVDRNWKSFFAAVKDYGKNPGKYSGKPELPNYLKNDKRVVVELTTGQIKNKDGYAFFALSSFKNLNNTFKLINKDARIFAARFVPVGGKNTSIDAYSLEIIQQIDIPEKKENSSRIAGIDLGINNLVTVVSNCGVDPIAVNGRPLKSINVYYNKKMAEMRSELKLKNNKDWSKRLGNFTKKRNKKVMDYIHKTSKIIVDWCVENNIDTVVCGHNVGWKKDSDMGKINNQSFTSIPHSVLIQKIQYKCETRGIKFIETEEGYTSGTSFLDRESPVKDNYDKTRRKYRGMFIANTGTEINADVNGAYQIIKKAFPDSFNENVEYGVHPKVLNIK